MEESSLKRYKGWEEVVVSNDKGKREVHYYLKDGLGGADLAVVGRERSLRHMSYRTVDGFIRGCHAAEPSPSPNCSPSLADGAAAGLKWKTRREVVDWLTSIVSDNSTIPYRSSPIVENFSDYEETEGPSSKAVSSSKPSLNSVEFAWLGSSWTCKKKRKHYRSFCRRGITISVHDFVLIMGEDNKRLVAYVEDLYSDSKNTNMVSVQWFHKPDEIPDISIPPDSKSREIFFSFCFQELIIECIDGLASVLSQSHFDRFYNQNGSGLSTRYGSDPFLCRRIVDNGEVKDFDVTGLKGYWSQETLRSMFQPTPLRLRVKIKKGGKEGKKGTMTARWQLLPGQQVEVLSQDSGIKGCWFRCLILRKHLDRIKVRYLDVPDADGSSFLEEWVWGNRAANKDEMEIRMEGRTTVRPVPVERSPGNNIEVGSIVDARWLDGLWEGIVVRSDPDRRFLVYFPGEKRVSVFGLDDLRHSNEWVGHKWHPLNGRKDIANSISLPPQIEYSIPLPKPNTKESVKCENSSQERNNNNSESSLDLKRSLSLDGLKWSSRKKRRFSPHNNSGKPSPGSSSGFSNEETESGFGVLDLESTVDNNNSHENNCKIGGGDSSLFGAPISISNLVMSQ
ncbi:hypothetical protein LUZ60_003132 [Juncus effusus]|nr:hypothetical protein LUZ60_003132 [Juncus effusus]